MKSGFVSIIGRPNSGKSTLLNAIIEHKIAITSDVAGTTRNIIKGIYNRQDLQIVFVDTPGIHKPQDKLGKILNEQAYYTLNNIDVILFIVDITKEVGSGDKFILDKLKKTSVPVILILNKIDKIKYEEILPKIATYKDLYPFKEIIPLSAKKKISIDNLITAITKYLKDSIEYYPPDKITDSSEYFIVSELIREKALQKTRQEVPHSLTCKIDYIEDLKDKVKIAAFIIVDRENLKHILIGKKGSMIKSIGTSARKEIEDLLAKKVYLDLKVKVVKNWREQDNFLNQELGFKDFNE